MFGPSDYRIIRTGLLESQDKETRSNTLAGLLDAIRKKEVRGDDFQIQRLFESTVPDGREFISEFFDPSLQGNGKSAVSLMESGNVNTGAFSTIVKEIAATHVMDAYEAEIDPVVGLIPTIKTNRNGERVPGVSQIGDLGEDVPEEGEYPRVGLSEDWMDTPQTTKSGLIIGITKEAIFFNYPMESVILSRCSAVGSSLGIRKSNRAIDCLIDENRTVHRYNRKDRGKVATYGNNSGYHDWDNLEASNGLVNYTDVDNMDALLSAIRDPNTGEPITLPKGKPSLICARGLRMTARNIVNASEIVHVLPGYATSANPMEVKNQNQFQNAFEVVSSERIGMRLATDTDWFYGWPELAFRCMENWPITTVQAPVNSEDEFKRDIIMQWKSSERSVYYTWEPRRMGKSTA